MPLVIAPPEMKKLSMPQAESQGYIRQACEVEYQEGLAKNAEGNVIVNVDQYKARELTHEAGDRLSTAAFEHILSEKGINNPAFSDLKKYWQWTDTGLLIPKGKKQDYTRTRGDRTYRLRIVTEGGEPVGELWVPEGNGKLVKEWSAFGLPAETVPESEHKKRTETHFYFDSDMKEIGVIRDGLWGHHGDRCFDLDVRFSPSRSDSVCGFRLIRGSAPKYSVSQ